MKEDWFSPLTTCMLFINIYLLCTVTYFVIGGIHLTGVLAINYLLVLTGHVAFVLYCIMALLILSKLSRKRRLLLTVSYLSMAFGLYRALEESLSTYSSWMSGRDFGKGVLEVMIYLLISLHAWFASKISVD
jgi:hypothetical protein